MIYIVSAFISLFITSALIIALVWCNYQYKRLTRSTKKFMKMIIKLPDETVKRYQRNEWIIVHTSIHYF